MADDDMEGQMYDDDFDFFYVEDTYPLADELAETAIPDPGYAGTSWELDFETYDYDLFEYWDDLEYGSDDYWDSGGVEDPSQKRKQGEVGKKPAVSEKRRKLGLKETGADGAIFVSMAERLHIWGKRAPARKGLKSFALLPDWRQKCAKADGYKAVKAMPVEMQMAAEGQDDVLEQEDEENVDMMQDGEEGWEDEDEAEEEGDIQAQLANLDPEMLKSILRQKLGDAGLDGMDEGAFMQTIGRMLSGDGGADEAAGELANSLLGQATQGNDTALSGWLSQQGVSLDNAEEDDDADSVATAELPADSRTSKAAKSMMQTSPPDSAIELAKNGRTAEMAMHDGSPKAAKKRLSSVANADADAPEGSVRKRKKVTFDVPASQETEAAATQEDGAVVPPASGEDTPVSEPFTNGGDSNPTVSVKQIRSSNSTTTTIAGEEPADSTTVSSRTATADAKTVAANAEKATASAKKAKANAKPGKEDAKTATANAKAAATNADAVTANAKGELTGPAMATRKRKARADEEEEPPPPQKKQTRKTAAAKNDEGAPSYARPTRATRARSGK